MRFRDREQAGEELADALREYAGRPVVVYALPRGGVVLGRIVADRLGAPLDLLIPRKIGHPTDPEYAIAAVAESGDVARNEEGLADVDPAWFEKAVERERQEARRRRRTYLADSVPTDVTGRTAIVVDDGIATGLTMKAAIADLKRRAPEKIVIAVPVVPQDSAIEIGSSVDALVALDRPSDYLGAVGAYYDTFDQVDDATVVALMQGSR